MSINSDVKNWKEMLTFFNKLNKEEMYKQNKIQKTSLKRNESVEGETIETKVERVTTNKEPITDNAPTIYTERKDGVLPSYDIRTDRFEVAVEAMEKVTKTDLAKRQSRLEEREKIMKNNGEAEPIQGTPGETGNQ